MLSVPIRSKDRLLGAMTLYHQEGGRRHTHDDLEVAGELARRFAAAIDNAQLFRIVQHAVRLRDDFLATAGHELRTPITSLMLYVQALLKQTRALEAGQAPPRLVQHLERTESQVARLTLLVNQLLDVSLIGSGRLALRLEAVALRGLVLDVVERYESRHGAGASVHVLVPESLEGSWDRLRLEQIVANLVSNAMKYGDGSPVTVAAHEEAGVATLSVHDEGIGIPLQHHERIFGRFERAVAHGHYGGIGLGLWITRQLVESMGGTIGFESHPGEGTTFTVRLPVAPTAAAA
jgi:signal transduction histidine kinase